MDYIKPKKLKKGDCIGIISPSSPQRDEARLNNGIRYFEQCGYNVKPAKNVFKRLGYLAGTDEERASDLNEMINDKDVKMIIAGRGGYGVTRILDQIDYNSLRKNPKIIVGFSDVTALNFAVLKKSKLINFTGAMPGVDFYDLEKIPTMTEEYFWRSLTSNKPLGKVKQNLEIESVFTNKINSKKLDHKAYNAVGKLLAGNLTLITSICGTKYFPNFKNSILLLEEIGEEAYRVDRMFAQLYNCGILSELSGLAFGAFTETKPTRVSVEPLPIEDVFQHYANRLSVPIIKGIEYGHIYPKLTLPIGVQASINAVKREFKILESGVE